MVNPVCAISSQQNFLLPFADQWRRAAIAVSLLLLCYLSGYSVNGMIQPHAYFRLCLLAICLGLTARYWLPAASVLRMSMRSNLLLFHLVMSTINQSKELSELAVKIQAGSRQAEEQFYRKALQHVLVFVRVKLNYHSDSEEVAHKIITDVMLAIREDNIKELKSLPAFIHRVTQNQVNNWMRQKYAEKKFLSPNNESWEFAGEKVDTLETIISQEQLAHIVKFLRRLGKKQRQVVYLRCMHGMAYREISKILGIREDDARQIVRRVRISLNELFDK